MNPTTRAKKIVFLLVSGVAAIVAVVYTAMSMRTDPFVADGSGPSTARALPSMESASDLSGRGSDLDPTPQAYLASINMTRSADTSRVEFRALGNASADRISTELRCERSYFTADRGLCLSREIRLFSAFTIATVVGADFRPLFDVEVDGIPSRTRISPDSRYGAFTVFVTGHDYASTDLSTATLLLDLVAGETLANLEEFEVFRDGEAIRSMDFNYWGVTFQADSNFFYATLRTGGVNYLVRGDIAAHTATVVYEGVECPSISPDETRIAFKKMTSRAGWQLTVLDLATLKETPLAETRSVDDQAEWLDDDHVLYSLVDLQPPNPINIMVVPADGSGRPEVFAADAVSPAVLR